MHNVCRFDVSLVEQSHGRDMEQRGYHKTLNSLISSNLKKRIFLTWMNILTKMLKRPIPFSGASIGPIAICTSMLPSGAGEVEKTHCCTGVGFALVNRLKARIHRSRPHVCVERSVDLHRSSPESFK